MHKASGGCTEFLRGQAAAEKAFGVKSKPPRLAEVGWKEQPRRPEKLSRLPTSPSLRVAGTEAKK